jgi:nucleotide-binding universal stress UspA family protein
MEAIRKVLAATDFSASGKQAARRAAWIAAGHGAELTILHVDEPDALVALRDLFDRRDLGRAVAEQARMQLDALSQEIEQRHGLQVQRQLRSGQVVDELNAASAEDDVLVLGARGASPVREFVLGTTAERLVRLARRPVVVVRGEPEHEYRQVLVAVDFSAASEAALRAALRLAPRASFHVLHCYDVPFEGKLRLAGASDADIERCRDHQLAQAQQQLQSLLGRAGDGRPVGTLLRRGDPRLELLQSAADLGADLVAVGKQGRSLVGDALLGSLTSWAVAECPCDVLVVPGAPA